MRRSPREMPITTPPPIDQQVTFLYCADLDAADAFYRGLLGLPLILDQGACRIYRVGRDAFLGFCRATTNLPPGAPAGAILTLVVRSTAEVDQWDVYLRTRDAAGRIERPPTHNPDFAIYHLFLRDPAGYLVEIQAFLDPAWPGREAVEARP